ncbi:hypothetical protein D3C84_1055970 [compost metagenome]
MRPLSTASLLRMTEVLLAESLTMSPDKVLRSTFIVATAPPLTSKMTPLPPTNDEPSLTSTRTVEPEMLGTSTRMAAPLVLSTCEWFRTS